MLFFLLSRRFFPTSLGVFIQLGEMLTRTYARPWLGLRINIIDRQNNNLSHPIINNKKTHINAGFFSNKVLLG